MAVTDPLSNRLQAYLNPDRDAPDDSVEAQSPYAVQDKQWYVPPYSFDEDDRRSRAENRARNSTSLVDNSASVGDSSDGIGGMAAAAPYVGGIRNLHWEPAGDFDVANRQSMADTRTRAGLAADGSGVLAPSAAPAEDIDALKSRLGFSWGKDVPLDPDTGRPVDSTVLTSAMGHEIQGGPVQAKEAQGGGGFYQPDINAIPLGQRPASWFQDQLKAAALQKVQAQAADPTGEQMRARERTQATNEQIRLTQATQDARAAAAVKAQTGLGNYIASRKAPVDAQYDDSMKQFSQQFPNYSTQDATVKSNPKGAMGLSDADRINYTGASARLRAINDQRDKAMSRIEEEVAMATGHFKYGVYQRPGIGMAGGWGGGGYPYY